MENIEEKLETINFQGVSGKISFDENGDVGPNYDVYKVTNNQFVKIN